MYISFSFLFHNSYPYIPYGGKYRSTVVLVILTEKWSLINHSVEEDTLNFHTTLGQNMRRIWKYVWSYYEFKENEGRYSLDRPIYFPSVLLPVMKHACSVIYAADGCQRETKKEWMQNGQSLSKTTCQIEIEAIPFVPVNWVSHIDICWWEFVLDGVLHFTSQGLSRYLSPSPPLYTPFPALRS